MVDFPTGVKSYGETRIVGIISPCNESTVRLLVAASIVESLKSSYLLNGTLFIVGLLSASVYLSCVLNQKPFIGFQNDAS